MGIHTMTNITPFFTKELREDFNKPIQPTKDKYKKVLDDFNLETKNIHQLIIDVSLKLNNLIDSGFDENPNDSSTNNRYLLNPESFSELESNLKSTLSLVNSRIQKLQKDT